MSHRLAGFYNFNAILYLEYLDEAGCVERDGVRCCMLIYSKAREQSPEAANAVLQIEIAGSLWCDR